MILPQLYSPPRAPFKLPVPLKEDAADNLLTRKTLSKIMGIVASYLPFQCTGKGIKGLESHFRIVIFPTDRKVAYSGKENEQLAIELREWLKQERLRSLTAKTSYFTASAEIAPTLVTIKDLNTLKTLFSIVNRQSLLQKLLLIVRRLCPNVESLDFSLCPAVTYHILKLLCKLKHLSSLTLASTTSTEKDLVPLASLTSL